MKDKGYPFEKTGCYSAVGTLTHLTPFSKNAKTGPIPVSTSSKETCPDSCPFKGNGCYAEGGPLAIHWRHVTKGNRGLEWEDFLSSIRKLRRNTLWRHNQAGDLVGANDRIHAKSLAELVAANKGRRGFTYTHYPMLAEDIKSDIYTSDEKEIVAHWNRTNIKVANENGFTINISANGPAHAKKLKELGIAPVVSVVSEDFETDGDIVVCPATTRDDANCFNCELCQKQHSKVVGFPVHGSRKKTAEQQICQY